MFKRNTGCSNSVQTVCSHCEHIVFAFEHVINSEFVVKDAYGDMVGVGDWRGRTDNLVLEKVV